MKFIPEYLSTILKSSKLRIFKFKVMNNKQINFYRDEQDVLEFDKYLKQNNYSEFL